MRDSKIDPLARLAWMLCCLPAAVAADFSASSATLHPQYPEDEPFIVEVSGTWPSDCHPGEQRPVVTSFDGRAVVIDFEIVVVHVTCNVVDTDYRVLVDMSAALRETGVSGEALDLRVMFGGATLEQSLDVYCPVGAGCASPKGVAPERGLYVTPARSHEGLLLARQGGGTAVYPLVYNDAGAAEWLFAVGRMREDTLFAPLTRWSDGDCFDCEPTGAPASMSQIGHLSVLFDGPATLQVKVDDRPFTEYRRLVYGHRVFPWVPPTLPALTDLEGRWALRDNEGSDPPLGDLTRFLPPAFDITLQEITPASGPAVAEVSYLVARVTGEELGQLFCAANEPAGAVCEFIDPTDQAEPLLLFRPLAPSTMEIRYGRAVIAVGTPPGGTAVRLD